jgi:WD40 repeat protein
MPGKDDNLAFHGSVRAGYRDREPFSSEWIRVLVTVNSMTTAQSATSELDQHRRFQFHLSQLFWLVLVMAVAIHQVLSPNWTVAERWLLISWFVGWVTGLAIGHARAKRAILTATIGGTAFGFLVALVIYFGFADLVRKRTMSFHDEVIYPLVALFVLAVVSSAFLAAILYGAVYVRGKLKRAMLQNHSARHVAILIWLAKAIGLLAVGAILINWFAPAFSWQPIAERHISHTEAGSMGAVAISPDNKLIALGSRNGFVELWQLPSLQPAAHYNLNSTNGPQSIVFSGDGARLTCFSTFDPRIRFINVSSGEQLNEINVGSWALMAVSAPGGSPETLSVVSWLKDHRLEIGHWNATSGTKTHGSILDDPGWAGVVHVKRGLLAYLKWSGPRGAAGENTISLHRLSDGQHLANGPTIRNVTSSFWPCFSHDGDWICMQHVVWNHQTHQSHEVPGHGMCFLPDGRLIAVQTKSSGPVLQFGLAGWSIWLHRTPFVRRLLSVHRRSRVLVYDIETRQTTLSSAWLREVGMAWLSPDGTRMATQTDGNLKIWSVPAN